MKQYRSIHSIRFPAGDNLELVYSMVNRSGRILTRQQADLLDGCQEFRTLDEHALQAYNEIQNEWSQTEATPLELSARALISDGARPPNYPVGHAREQGADQAAGRAQIESIARQLTELVEAGLLVSDVDVLGRCKQAVKRDRVPQIASIGVVTRNRQKCLKHCLESYIENCERHGRENDFVVMDDSDGAEVRVEIRRMLRELKKKHNVEISYGGAEEKTQFAKALTAESDVPPDIVRFALFDVEECGYSTGANRNALLLHTAGDLFLSVDDDTVCLTGKIRKAKSGLALSSKKESFIKFEFCPDRASALQSVIVVDEDVLASHEQLLGRAVSDCVFLYSELNDHPDMSCASLQLLNGMQRGGNVIATFNGVVGDSGMHSPAGCLLLEGDSREWLFRSEPVYRNAYRSREMIRVADRLTLSDSIWCMATTLGLDNRSLLPPFMPVYRNQDGLFERTIRTCFDSVYSGYLPVTILHAPAEDRQFDADAVWRDASGCRFCDVVTACIRSFNAKPGVMGGEEGLRALGRYLSALGGLALPDLEDLVRVQMWRIKSDIIAKLEDHLETYEEKPDYWAKDVRKYLTILRESLLNDDCFVPRDLSEKLGPSEARRKTRRLIRRFGELLYWWPEIVGAAKRLRERGCRPAITI